MGAKYPDWDVGSASHLPGEPRQEALLPVPQFPSLLAKLEAEPSQFSLSGLWPITSRQAITHTAGNERIISIHGTVPRERTLENPNG